MYSVKVAALGCFGLVSGLAMAEKIPSVVPSPVEQAFIPLGFDDNDNVEVVLHGHFINSCYKTGDVKVTVDEATKSITLSPTALHYKDGYCLQMQIPFLQSVRLGVVKEGEYKVVVENQPNAKTERLSIKRTESSNPDDYLYAPISSVAIRKETVAENNTTRSIMTLKGEYPYMFNGCMEIQRVRKYMSPGNVMVVLPIAEVVQGETCLLRGGDQKFERQVVVDEKLEGDILLHVRTLNGESLNHLEENY